MDTIDNLDTGELIARHKARLDEALTGARRIGLECGTAAFPWHWHDLWEVLPMATRYWKQAAEHATRSLEEAAEDELNGEEKERLLDAAAKARLDLRRVRAYAALAEVTQLAVNEPPRPFTLRIETGHHIDLGLPVGPYDLHVGQHRETDEWWASVKAPDAAVDFVFVNHKNHPRDAAWAAIAEAGNKTGRLQ